MGHSRSSNLRYGSSTTVVNSHQTGARTAVYAHASGAQVRRRVCTNDAPLYRWKIEPFKTIYVRLPRTDERCGKTRFIVNRRSVKSYLGINHWPDGLCAKVNINYSVVVRVQMRAHASNTFRPFVKRTRSPPPRSVLLGRTCKFFTRAFQLGKWKKKDNNENRFFSVIIELKMSFSAQ